MSRRYRNSGRNIPDAISRRRAKGEADGFCGVGEGEGEEAVLVEGVRVVVGEPAEEDGASAVLLHVSEAGAGAGASGFVVIVVVVRGG